MPSQSHDALWAAGQCHGPSQISETQLPTWHKTASESEDSSLSTCPQQKSDWKEQPSLVAHGSGAYRPLIVCTSFWFWGAVLALLALLCSRLAPGPCPLGKRASSLCESRANVLHRYLTFIDINSYVKLLRHTTSLVGAIMLLIKYRQFCFNVCFENMNLC